MEESERAEDGADERPRPPTITQMMVSAAL